jgi:hypothetical protein
LRQGILPLRLGLSRLLVAASCVTIIALSWLACEVMEEIDSNDRKDVIIS